MSRNRELMYKNSLCWCLQI